MGDVGYAAACRSSSSSIEPGVQWLFNIPSEGSICNHLPGIPISSCVVGFRPSGRDAAGLAGSLDRSFAHGPGERDWHEDMGACFPRSTCLRAFCRSSGVQSGMGAPSFSFAARHSTILLLPSSLRWSVWSSQPPGRAPVHSAWGRIPQGRQRLLSGGVNYLKNAGYNLLSATQQRQQLSATHSLTILGWPENFFAESRRGAAGGGPRTQCGRNSPTNQWSARRHYIQPRDSDRRWPRMQTGTDTEAVECCSSLQSGCNTPGIVRPGCQR